MLKFLKMSLLLATGAASVGVGTIVTSIATSSEAEARMCFRRECAYRRPFVCKGPIGSCGFRQGVCVRWKTVRYFVPGSSCVGKPDPVR
jgi:hypothetical protein